MRDLGWIRLYMYNVSMFLCRKSSPKSIVLRQILVDFCFHCGIHIRSFFHSNLVTFLLFCSMLAQNLQIFVHFGVGATVVNCFRRRE